MSVVKFLFAFKVPENRDSSLLFIQKSHKKYVGELQFAHHSSVAALAAKMSTSEVKVSRNAVPVKQLLPVRRSGQNF